MGDFEYLFLPHQKVSYICRAAWVCVKVQDFVQL